MDWLDFAKKELIHLAAVVIAKKTGRDPAQVEKFLNYLIQFGYLAAGILPGLLGNPNSIVDIFLKALDNWKSFLGSMDLTDEQLERMMDLPRCGVSDVLHLNTEEARWRKNRLNYFVQSYVSGISQSDQNDLIALAWRQWADVADLGFTQTNDPGQADLLISTGRGASYGFDGPSGTLAWAQLPPGGDQQLLMRFDLDERWIREANQPGILFLNVACHEFGHMLGLDHSRNKSALMAPYYSAGITKPQSNDDIPRIQALYGKPTAPQPPKPPEPTMYRLVVESTSPMNVVS